MKINTSSELWHGTLCQDTLNNIDFSKIYAHETKPLHSEPFLHLDSKIFALFKISYSIFVFLSFSLFFFQGVFGSEGLRKPSDQWPEKKHGPEILQGP